MDSEHEQVDVFKAMDDAVAKARKMRESVDNAVSSFKANGDEVSTVYLNITTGDVHVFGFDWLVPGNERSTTLEKYPKLSKTETAIELRSWDWEPDDKDIPILCVEGDESAVLKKKELWELEVLFWQRAAPQLPE